MVVDLVLWWRIDLFELSVESLKLALEKEPWALLEIVGAFFVREILLTLL